VVLVNSGGFLSFQAVTSQVLSALESLTAVFEMGTGVASPSYPPEMVGDAMHPQNRIRKRKNWYSGIQLKAADWTSFSE
jgi:hypothetical protein